MTDTKDDEIRPEAAKNAEKTTQSSGSMIRHKAGDAARNSRNQLTKKERLALELRKNLARRKAQSRARLGAEKEVLEDSGEEQAEQGRSGQ